MASTRQVVLVTGANTGIGFETVKALYNHASKQYDILLGGRSIEKAKAAAESLKSANPGSKSTITPFQIDISSDESIEKAFTEVSSLYDRVDALVNNAGASFDKELKDGNMTMRDMWNKSWDTNVSGTQVMTHTFVPLLLKSSDPRLLFVTSGTATLTETEDPTSRLNVAPPKGWPKPATGLSFTAYRSSKTGMNMMMREWTRTLKEDGVKVWCISPGLLATGLGGIGADNLAKLGAGAPSLGGEFIRDVVDGKRDHDHGKAIRRDMIQPW